MTAAPAKQLSLLSHDAFKPATRRAHGGALGQGRRKTARPMTPKLPLHLVLKASQAKGPQSMLHPRHEKGIKRLTARLGRRFQVRILQQANSGNHLHLLVQAKTREGFQNFLRALAGMIARAITGAQKGVRKGKFWDALAFSRMVTWGRELRNVNFYVLQNELESLGVWRRRRPAPAPPPAPRAAPKIPPPPPRPLTGHATNYTSLKNPGCGKQQRFREV